jgi:enoyl-CoA hydratase/carnithine racemase
MIQYHVNQHIAEILLDNPPVNGITDEVLDTLMERLRQAGHDPQVRAIIIGSAIPGRFSGGLDLSKFLQGSPEDVHRVVHKLYSQLFELNSSLSKPVIAAIGGAVRGGGMSIAITCDMIVAADDATFGYPELEVGLLPAIHFNHLPRLVGRHRAFDLLMTGRVFDVREAVELGLVARTAPAAQLMDKARELAAVLAAKSPTLMRMGKAAFVRATDQGYRVAATQAVDLVSAVVATRDGREGLTAFVEKRKPQWRQT